MIGLFSINRFLLSFILLLAAISANATTPIPPDLLHFQVEGIDKISNPGTYTLNVSMSPDDVLLKDGNAGTTIEFTTVGSMVVKNTEMLHFQVSHTKPYNFPLSITIPDNDTSGVIVTVTCYDYKMPYTLFFVTTSDTIEKFMIDPRELTKIHPADPRHPDNQKRPNPNHVPYQPPVFVEPDADTIIVNPSDTTKKIRIYVDKIVFDTNNKFEKDEEMIHFILSLQDVKQYVIASRLFDKLEPMDSSGYYQGWAPLKVSRELTRLKIPHKDYPHYPSRYFTD